MSPKKENSIRTVSMVMFITLAGKILGLLRDRLLAVHYGAGMQAGAFLTASRIPRVFFDVLFASAIAACFIPVLSEALEKKGKEHAFRLSCAFLTAVTLFAALFTVLGMALAEPLAALMSDTADGAALALTARLTRMLFPTALFTAVAFCFVGILQTLGEFRVPALISAVSNLVVIGYYLLFHERYGLTGLAVAFLVGWLLQALVQLPALWRKGFRWRPRLELRSPEMGKILRLMPPVMVSTWVLPVNLTINARYGWRLYDGAGVTAIDLASNLYLILAGVFILSVTNVVFPRLSRLTAGARDADFRDTLRGALRATLYLVFPMTAGLMLVSRPLVTFLYGGGAFDTFAVELTSRGLFWMSLGMTGYALQSILSRAYFARQEGKVPLVAGLCSMALNLALCAALTDRMGITGLALASAASSTLYGLLLLLPLARREGGLSDAPFSAALGRMALAAALLPLPCLGVLHLCAGLGERKGALLLTLLCTAAAGGLWYLLLTRLLGVEEAELVVSRLVGIGKRGLSMIPIQSMLQASVLVRLTAALSRWFARQWEESALVRAYLNPSPLGRAAGEHSLFFRLWNLLLALLRGLYAALRLDKLFSGSIFQQTLLWCCLVAGAATLLPTMGALGLTAAAYLSLALCLAREREKTLVYAPMNRYLYLLAAAYLAAVGTSVTPRGSLFPGLLTVCFLLFPLVIVNTVRTRTQLKNLTALLVLAGTLVALVGIGQYFLGVVGAEAWVDNDMFSEITTRVYGTLQNPNMLAGYLVLILPLGVALLLEAEGWGTRVFWLCCCSLGALCLTLTFSRGGYLGLIIAGGVFVLLKKPRLLLLAPVGLVALYFLLPDTVIERFTSIGDLGDSSTSYRVSIWMGSIAMLKDYWLCGVGPGTEAFNLVYPAYSYNAANAQHAHNLFLQLLAEGGVSVLGLFLLTIWAFVRQLCAALSRLGKGRDRVFLIASLAGAAGFLAQGMTDHSFYNYRVMLAFWVVVGLGAAWANACGERGTTP